MIWSGNNSILAFDRFFEVNLTGGRLSKRISASSGLA